MPKSPPAVTISNPRFGGRWADALRTLLFAVFVLASAGSVVGLGAYAHYAADLPPLPDFSKLEFSGVSTLYADDGQLLAEHYSERRVLLPYERIPRTLILAVTATEDARFFSHSGVDLRGIARAAYRNLRAGAVVEGGSTITQQLAKSFLGDEQSLTRKIREAIFARRLEDVYDKEQILLLYLNRIEFGHHSHGLQAAAQNYFRRNVWNLSLGEMTLLAGLPQAPSRLNPLAHPERARERREWVLGRMADAGYISAEQAQQAANEPIRVYPLVDERGDKAPGFSEHVRQWLGAQFGPDWIQDRLDVFTTARVDQSIDAERAVQDGLHALDQRQGYRGPLGRVQSYDEWQELLHRARAERRSDHWSRGDLAVAIVTEVDASGMRVALTPDDAGYIHLERMAWAGEYSEFPVDPRSGKRDDSGSVSFEPKLTKPAERFAKGDVVLVRVTEPANAREARLEGLPRPQSLGIALELAQMPQVEGALMAVDVHTGAVTAEIGAYDWDRSEFDRTSAPRQTGSTMKPLAYSLAYREQLPPSRVISGAPVDIEGYRPTKNRAAKDRTAWDGLATSENSVSLRVYQYALERAGAEGWSAWGRALGLTRKLHGYPSEVLGTDQSLADMTRAFETIASNGSPAPRRWVRRVVDGTGRTRWRQLHVADASNSTQDSLDALYDAVRPAPASAMPTDVAYVTKANLTDVIQRGTARRAAKALTFDAAGKTGTLPYDVWFIGFSSRWLAGVWVGADRRERVLGQSVDRNRVSGSDTALPIWIDWMQNAHAGVGAGIVPGPVPGPPPHGVQTVSIDPTTGLLAVEGGQALPHIRGTAPTRTTQGGSTVAPVAPAPDDFDF